jgi:hypothetical protein
MNSDWRKSTYSGGSSNACVEVAMNGSVLIRDTTNRDGATLTVTPTAWSTFTSTIK